MDGRSRCRRQLGRGLFIRGRLPSQGARETVVEHAGSRSERVDTTFETSATSELLRLETLGWQAPVPAIPRAFGGCAETCAGVVSAAYWTPFQATAGKGSGSTRARMRSGSCARGVDQEDLGRRSGSGAMAKRLGRYGIDVCRSSRCRRGARIARMGAEVFCGTFRTSELPSGSLPAVGLFDVLEHLEEPSDLLGEVARAFSSDGTLVVTVPAYQWLWSAEDEALGHFRRYSTKTLRALWRESRFSVVSAPIALPRSCRRRRAENAAVSPRSPTAPGRSLLNNIAANLNPRSSFEPLRGTRVGCGSEGLASWPAPIRLVGPCRRAASP